MRFSCQQSMGFTCCACVRKWKHKILHRLSSIDQRNKERQSSTASHRRCTGCFCWVNLVLDARSKKQVLASGNGCLLQNVRSQCSRWQLNCGNSGLGSSVYHLQKAYGKRPEKAAVKDVPVIFRKHNRHRKNFRRAYGAQ